MPTEARKRIIVQSILALMALLIACSAFFLVPICSIKAVGTYDNASIADKALTYVGGSGTVACSDAGKTGGDQCKQFVNCIVYMVSSHTQWPVDPAGNYQNSYSDAGGTEITDKNSVAKGDIIQVGDSDTSSPLHTAIVVTNKGSGSFNVVDANWNYDGKVTQHDYMPPSGARFWRMGTVMNVTPTPTPSPAPPIIALKSARGPDGTAIETYAATASRVTQHWYYDGGNSGTTDITDQTNIVGIDKINQANGTESLYTAVPDGVYESWWNASSGGVHTSKIVYPGLSGITLSGVRGVIAENTVESGVTVHHLYILAADGPYEAWWKDGGDGVHLGRLFQINGAVTFTHSIGPDGSEQLYVAVPTWVYEVSWFPGGTVNMRPVLNITQADIRSVEKGANLSGGSQLLYTTTSTAVWQTYWPLNGSFSTGTIAASQVNALQALKVVTPDGIHHVYLATPDHVQEYWWPPAFGGGEIIRISQGNIAAIAQLLDGNMQLLLTAAGSNVWETWWNSSQAPTTPSTPLFSVTA